MSKYLCENCQDIGSVGFFNKKCRVCHGDPVMYAINKNKKHGIKFNIDTKCKSEEVKEPMVRDSNYKDNFHSKLIKAFSKHKG